MSAGVSPASVTTISSELIDTGLIEEVAAPRDNEAGRAFWRRCGWESMEFAEPLGFDL